MVVKRVNGVGRTASIERSASHDDLDVTLPGFRHCNGGRSTVRLKKPSLQCCTRNVCYVWIESVGRTRKTRGKLRHHVLIYCNYYRATVYSYYKAGIETRARHRMRHRDGLRPCCRRNSNSTATTGHSHQAECVGQQPHSDCRECGSTSSLYDMMVLLILEVSTQVTKSSMCLNSATEERGQWSTMTTHLVIRNAGSVMVSGPTRI